MENKLINKMSKNLNSGIVIFLVKDH